MDVAVGHRVVRLSGVPVALFADMLERQADLVREFRLASRTHGRCRALVLQERYLDFTAATHEAVLNALHAGAPTVDVTLTVSAQAREEAAEFLLLLAEIDELCEREEFLTLPADPRIIDLRRWYLGEFISQLEGETPTPWPSDPAREGA